MQKSKNMNLRCITVGGILASFSIVFGKLLAFNIGEMFRISFENLPIILAGIILGPLFGGVVGLVADVTGCLVVGYAINPLITAGSAVIGGISGLVFSLLDASKVKHILKVTMCTVFAHLFGSVIINTATKINEPEQIFIIVCSSPPITTPVNK